MKKLALSIFLSSVALLGALMLPPQERNEIQEEPKSSKNTYQEEQFMKPAWYRYFNLKKNNELSDKSLKKEIEFIFPANQKDKDFIHFEIFNGSGQNIHIRTQNGSLIMIQEAKNRRGEWKPIEYWCYDWGDGADFGTLELASKESVSLFAPHYIGDFKTQLRFKLKTGDEKSKEDIYYSPSFEGSIYESQFIQNEVINDQKEAVSFLESR